MEHSLLDYLLNYAHEQGVPTIIAIYLVYWITVKLSKKLDKICDTLEKVKDLLEKRTDGA